MAIVRGTKCFEFEMAHALWNYDGPCQHIHGHSYKLEICIKGEPLHAEALPKNGMIFDFKLLKELVTAQIIKPFDHAFVVCKHADYAAQIPSTGISQLFEKHVIVDYQPTCENFVVDFARRIQKYLPREVELYSVKLHETASSYAEWYACDQ